MPVLFVLFKLPGKLNEVDADDNLPLDLALQGRQEGIAQTLVKYKVDVNMADCNKRCLIHKAINRGM
jgi:ankyrin repeat protein